MSSKFFNNSPQNTLFDKFKGIAGGMSDFHTFLAVVGYFRSSGYFKLRRELEDVREIKILVGINLDALLGKHNQALLLSANPEEAKEAYREDFAHDVAHAHYSPDVEEGILQMYSDFTSGRLQMRIHATKRLHAKFYLCLPQHHTPHSDGWVIMGSSNMSDAGLGTQEPARYELNVAMKDFEDVHYCAQEFWTLWHEAVPLSIDDIEQCRSQTHLGYQPTPYELYIKVLIEAFGDQVEDNFSMELPEGVKDLKYQKDAVIQGYQILQQHDGLYLADVVGLGKTLVAAMIARRFIQANGEQTSILVVHPPALRENWVATFRQFGIRKRAQFITSGSLSKVLNGQEHYKTPEQFDLIVVDEAHGFRSDSTEKYAELQRICKAPCANQGLLKGKRKKVMLLSATPLNNRPDDLLNQLLLFQDANRSTLDGITNLRHFFAPYIKRYKALMRTRGSRQELAGTQAQRNLTHQVDTLYEEIRSRVIDKLTVRRTRSNILNDPDYSEDIRAQGITFPDILPPEPLEYTMDRPTKQRLYATLRQLTDRPNPALPHRGGLHYACYRAIEFLAHKPDGKYQNAEQQSRTLASIYRIHMVKRLESSFHAFRQSLATLLRTTTDMIAMLQADRVIIATCPNVKGLMAKGMEFDQIIKHAARRGFDKADIAFQAADFRPEFLAMLHHDREILERLNRHWTRQGDDPKFREFRKGLDELFLDKTKNPSGKLVIFSESVDTLRYLHDRLTRELGRSDVLCVSSSNRAKLEQTIKANFDANHKPQEDRYRIILTTDVLAEGVNLHRANVVVNYDSPWNATRLMQRIGRVNRIGSQAERIYNYMFYPSLQGDNEIHLYKNALIKLQGFHSAFGEDAQIYSREEIVKEFKIYNSNVRDTIDRKIALLRQVRDLYASNRDLYHKIKALPLKSRVLRQGQARSGQSVIFLASQAKKEFYLASSQGVKAIDFLEAVAHLEAEPHEQPLPFTQPSPHYQHVQAALRQYRQESIGQAYTALSTRLDLDKTALEANRILRDIKRTAEDPELKAQCETLIQTINSGVYTQLPRELKAWARRHGRLRPGESPNGPPPQAKIAALARKYPQKPPEEPADQPLHAHPCIILSETFQ